MGRGRRELEKEPKKILYGEVEKKKKIIIGVGITILAIIVLFIIAMVVHNYII